jgi:hypothetical protein
MFNHPYVIEKLVAPTASRGRWAAPCAGRASALRCGRARAQGPGPIILRRPGATNITLSIAACNVRS